MTHRPRGTCRPAPRHRSPGRDAPGRAANAAPVPAAGSAGGAVPIGAARGSVPASWPGSLRPPGSPGVGGRHSSGAADSGPVAGGAWGAAAPAGQRLGRCAALGKTSPCRPPLVAVSADSLGGAPTTSHWARDRVGGKGLMWVCSQLPLQRLRPRDSRSDRSCALRGPRPQGARSVGGAERCSP